jgi:hypothetical protein
MERGQAYKVLTPEQQIEVRKNVLARSAAGPQGAGAISPRGLFVPPRTSATTVVGRWTVM